jgi:hypothetical protein
MALISFTFTGKEDPNREMMVSLTVYDNEEKVIGWVKRPFGDPRIFAREAADKFGTGMFIVEPVVSLDACLAKNKNIAHISHMEISVVEIKNL